MMTIRIPTMVMSGSFGLLDGWRLDELTCSQLLLDLVGFTAVLACLLALALDTLARAI